MILPISRRQLWRFGLFTALVAAAAYYVAWVLPAVMSAGGPAAPAPAEPPPGAAALPAAAGGPAEPLAAAPETNFFADFRLQRDRARGQQREMLEALLAREDTGAETRQTAQDQYLALSRIMGLEAQLEGLIRARGFADAVVYLGEDHAQVVVQAAALDRAQAAQVTDMVSQVAGVTPHAVRVTARP